MSRRFFPLGNVSKVMLIYFCTRFHLYIHAYALILQGRGLSLLQISSIESVVIITMFLAEVPTGIIADRIGRKWSVFLSTLLLLCGELIFFFSRSYPQYLVLAVFTGMGFAFSSGAVESLIYDSMPTENRDQAMKRVMGRYGSIGQIAFFISPILGAWIIGNLAPERVQLAILFTVTSLAVGVLVSLTLHEPDDPWKAERTSSLAIFHNGLTELRGSRQLQRIVLLTVFTATFTGTLITTLAPPYMVQNGVSAFGVGLALSLGSLLSAVTQPNVHRLERWLGERRTILAVTLLPGILYLVLAIAVGALPVWLIIMTMYGTNDLKNPLLSSYQNRLITSRSRATVLSMMNMLLSLFVGVMAPVYATIAGQSQALAFVLMGSMILGAGIVLRVGRLPMLARHPTEPLEVVELAPRMENS